MKPTKRKQSTRDTSAGLPDGWAIIEEALDGHVWYYPAWLFKHGATGYLAPVYFPPSDHDYREDRAEVRRFTRRARALAFVRRVALHEPGQPPQTYPALRNSMRNSMEVAV